jgi:hypothetical protein
MADYAHQLEFACFLIPDANDPESVIDTARLADRLDYDPLVVQENGP